jgi:SET domain-containing protein
MKFGFEVKSIDGKGLGIFATQDFKAGDLVESCPVILLSEKERDHIANTLLDNYIYPWHEETEDACMVLGYGSLINHSYTSNATWKQDYENIRMVYSAVKNIKAGEEITVNYNGDPNDAKPIEWFEVK